MCRTCEDKTSTNPDLCGIARAARKAEAAEIVGDREDEGLTFAEIAEKRGITKFRARKLFYEGVEVVDRDKRAVAEAVVSQLEEEIQLARRDLRAIADDPVERYKAREHLFKLYDRLMRYTGAEPAKQVNIKTGPNLPEPPDDPELDDIYRRWKDKHS